MGKKLIAGAVLGMLTVGLGAAAAGATRPRGVETPRATPRLVGVEASSPVTPVTRRVTPVTAVTRPAPAPPAARPAVCAGRCVTFAGHAFPYAPKRCDACVQAQLDAALTDPTVPPAVLVSVGVRWFEAHDRFWLAPERALRPGDPVVVDGTTYHVVRSAVLPVARRGEALAGAAVVLQTCAVPDGSVDLLVTAA